MRLKRGLIVAAVLFFAVLPSFAQQLGWSEIPNTKIGGNDTSCSGNCGVAINYPQSRNVIAAWGGGAFDTQRNRMIVWGGGHNDYSGNEIYAVDFDGTAAPLRLTNNTNPGACGTPSCDGGATPNARHTYHNMTYVPTSDSLFVFGGGLSGPGVTSYNDAWQFNFTTSAWTHLNPISTGMFDTPVYYIYYVEYYAPMDAVLIVGQYGLYRYNLNTRTMTTLKSTGGGIGYAYGAIDPIKNKLFIFEQSFTNFMWIDLTGADGYAYHSFTPTGAAMPGSWPGWAYDPVSGDLVGWSGGSTVYRFNTTTHNVTATSYSGGPGPRQANGTYGRWQYSPSLGAFTLVNSFDENAFVFRLNGGSPPPTDTTAPTVPTGLTASPVSQTQINLAWTASTDNIAVTGYKVFRNAAEIATTASVAYSATGLAPATTYVFTVAAYDAANNISAQSTAVSATTQSPPPPSGPVTVGPGKQYPTLSAAIAAVPSDSVIECDAGIYPNDSLVTTKNLTIRGVGGKCHLKWGSGDYRTNTAMIPNGKALFVTGGNVTLENLEFSGAKVSGENGAGIRYEGGNLTIRNSSFHDNENGIMGQAGMSNTLIIEYSAFERNGFCGAGGCAHNVYIGAMGKLVFRYNRSTDPTQGHTLKSRARINEVIGNTLSTLNGDGSYEAEFPNGGEVYLIDNIIEQGANTGNSTLVRWGAEGATNPNPKLTVVGNTLYNWRLNGSTFVQVSGSPAPALSIKNNFFVGPGTQLTGGSTDLSTNITLP
jgi:hypothetical protein